VVENEKIHEIERTPGSPPQATSFFKKKLLQSDDFFIGVNILD
jgi:hypothetical protein